jgi:hypothetical protein
MCTCRFSTQNVQRGETRNNSSSSDHKLKYPDIFVFLLYALERGNTPPEKRYGFLQKFVRILYYLFSAWFSPSINISMRPPIPTTVIPIKLRPGRILLFPFLDAAFVLDQFFLQCSVEMRCCGSCSGTYHPKQISEGSGDSFVRICSCTVN